MAALPEPNAAPDVAVIGGGYAGILAAARLILGGRSVVLVDPKPRFVHRLQLHRSLSGRVDPSLAWSRVLPRGVQLLQGRAIAWRGGSLEVRTDEGTRELRPRRVLIATGSRSRRPWRGSLVIDIEDLEAGRVLANRTRVVVVGGGATGVEAAAALVRSGRRVTLVAREFPGLGPQGSELLRAALTRLGVVLVEDRVREVGEGAVYLREGKALACDAVLPCIGFVPSASARQLGLPTDEHGWLRASPSLQVAPNTYAAGDALTLASMPWLSTGAASAMPMGAHAAASILADLAGEEPAPFCFGWTQKTFDLGGARALMQRLEPDGSPGRAVAGVGAAAFKSLLFGLAPRVGRWEVALGRALYSWQPGPPRTVPSGSWARNAGQGQAP